MLQGKSLEQFQRDSFGLLSEVATDSSTITRDTLPPFYSQFYQSGEDRRQYFNINNSIFSIDISGSTSTTQIIIENRTSDPTSPVSGRIWLRTDI